MNLSSLKVRNKLKKAFSMGYSIREAAIYAGCHKGTASRYSYLFPFSCPCGRPKEQHKGFCPERYKRHPVRRYVMKKLWQRQREENKKRREAKALEAKTLPTPLPTDEIQTTISPDKVEAGT